MAKRHRSEATPFTANLVIGSGDYGQATVDDAPGYKCVPIRRRRHGLLFASLHVSDSKIQLAEERFIELPFHPQWLATAPAAPEGNGSTTKAFYVAAGDDDMLHAIDGSSYQVESSMDALGGSAYVELSTPDWTGGAKWALCANYGSGVLSVLPLFARGALKEPAGRVECLDSGYHTRTIDPPTDSKQPWPLEGFDPKLADRQEACHPHQIVLVYGYNDQKNERLTWALACDLGADRVWTYEFDDRRGSLIGAVNSAQHLKLPAGSGPRHLVLLGEGKNGQLRSYQRDLLVCVACELSGELALCKFDTTHGKWNVLSTVDAMAGSGVTCSRSHHSGLSHIAASYSERYEYTIIYVASRTDNAIVAFRLERNGNAESFVGASTLTFVQRVSTKGVCTRHFAIINRPSEQAAGSSGGGGEEEEPVALVLGNQDSQTLVAYHIEPSDGTLREEGAAELKVLGVCPACIVRQCVEPSREEDGPL